MGDSARALEVQLDLIHQTEEAGEPAGYSYEEAGECLLALGREEEARPYFARAYEELSEDPWFPPDETARLERMKQLGFDE